MLGTAKPSRAWLAALAVLGGGAIAFGGPFQATRFVVIPTLAMVASTVAFQIRAARRAWRSGAAPLNTFIVTLGSPVAMLVATPDITAWLGFGELLGGLRLGPLATAGIAVMQSVAFSRTHILSLTRSDALNAELAGRVALLESQNRQIAVLNDELRHQITARSAELSDALAKLNTDAEGAIELGPEDVVGDRYRILRRLGSGAAGVVYEVVRVSDEQPFALKIMRGPRDRVALARFAREAQMAAQIRHPNVVSLVDIDVESRGILFLVMDLVLGPSLRAARERFGDTAWALPILRQVAEGLAAIHTQGIVHRDLKPANVILADRGDGVPPLVKIADFGIASLILDSADEETRREGDAPRAPPSTPSTPSDSRSKSDGSLTETGVVLGTPMYMAPEALIGARHAQGPADVFSFGVMAVELLTGARPFGDTPASVALPSGRTLSTSLRDPSRALAAEVAVLVEQCLRVDASERPTAGDLVRVFARQLPSSGTLAVGGRAKVERR
jgi:serine/threonine-protein kinase